LVNLQAVKVKSPLLKGEGIFLTFHEIINKNSG